MEKRRVGSLVLWQHTATTNGAPVGRITSWLIGCVEKSVRFDLRRLRSIPQRVAPKGIQAASAQRWLAALDGGACPVQWRPLGPLLFPSHGIRCHAMPYHPLPCHAMPCHAKPSRPVPSRSLSAPLGRGRQAAPVRPAAGAGSRAGALGGPGGGCRASSIFAPPARGSPSAPRGRAAQGAAPTAPGARPRRRHRTAAPPTGGAATLRDGERVCGRGPGQPRPKFSALGPREPGGMGMLCGWDAGTRPRRASPALWGAGGGSR